MELYLQGIGGWQKVSLFCAVCSGKLTDNRIADRHVSTLDCIADLKYRLKHAKLHIERMAGGDRRILTALRKHGQIPRRIQ